MKCQLAALPMGRQTRDSIHTSSKWAGEVYPRKGPSEGDAAGKLVTFLHVAGTGEGGKGP